MAAKLPRRHVVDVWPAVCFADSIVSLYITLHPIRSCGLFSSIRTIRDYFSMENVLNLKINM
jgi:hypothetical protein